MDTRRLSLLAVAAVALVAGCTSTPSTPTGSPSPTVRTVPGTFVYAPPEQNGKVTLQAWSPPGEKTTAMAVLDSADVLTSATLSPDGTRIAYVHGGASGSTALTVAALDGSASRVLLTGVEPYCDEPTWAPDGSRVIAMASPADHRAGTVAVAGGPFAPFATPVVGCHIVWSGDGDTIAYAPTSGNLSVRIAVAKSDGTGARDVPRLGADGGDTKRRSHSPMSLSSDGKLLALFVLQGDDPEGDAGRGLVANEIVDTTTGATVALPVEGELQQAYFLPSGGLVVRTKVKDTMRVSLLSADLKVIGAADEPMTLLTAVLIGYAGAGAGSR